MTHPSLATLLIAGLATLLLFLGLWICIARLLDTDVTTEDNEELGGGANGE